MSLSIRFTPEAEETFDVLCQQLRERWGERFVAKLETKILKAFDTISLTPHIYPVTDENTELRKWILHKNCSMLYRAHEDVVIIICFWDNRQDPIILP